jgi:hypothetical protein
LYGGYSFLSFLYNVSLSVFKYVVKSVLIFSVKECHRVVVRDVSPLVRLKLSPSYLCGHAMQVLLGITRQQLTACLFQLPFGHLDIDKFYSLFSDYTVVRVVNMFSVPLAYVILARSTNDATHISVKYDQKPFFCADLHHQTSTLPSNRNFLTFLVSDAPLSVARAIILQPSSLQDSAQFQRLPK